MRLRTQANLLAHTMPVPFQRMTHAERDARLTECLARSEAADTRCLTAIEALAETRADLRRVLAGDYPGEMK